MLIHCRARATSFPLGIERARDELVGRELRPQIDRSDPGRRVEPRDLLAVEQELDLGDAALDGQTDLLIAGGQPEKERQEGDRRGRGRSLTRACGGAFATGADFDRTVFRIVSGRGDAVNFWIHSVKPGEAQSTR